MLSLVYHSSQYWVPKLQWHLATGEVQNEESAHKKNICIFLVYHAERRKNARGKIYWMETFFVVEAIGKKKH